MQRSLEKAQKNWIYQSNRLIEASYSLTTAEQKIIRILASMIKKDDGDFKEYTFSTKQLIKLLNTSESRFYRDIDEITDRMMKRIIKIKRLDTNEFEKYHWISVAKYKNGLLKLKIDKEMKPFYLNMPSYTKYELQNILKFKSTYSFRLYELLKQYEKMKSRKFKVEDLRVILDIGKDEYPKYANLKQKIIKKAVEEINEKTDIHITFDETKKGRKVDSIEFFISSNRSKDEIAAAYTVSDASYKHSAGANNVLTFIHEPLTPVEEKKIIDAAGGNMNIIKEKYSIAQLQGHIDNIVAWLITAIKRDYKMPKSVKRKKPNSSSNERHYDVEELEKQLLMAQKD